MTSERRPDAGAAPTGGRAPSPDAPEAPPPGGRWGVLEAIVLIALALVIAGLAWLTESAK